MSYCQQMDTVHCTDNKADRKVGEYWERQFCILAAAKKMVFTPMQIGRQGSAQAFGLVGGGWDKYTLPDVTIWTYPGQHHEIKHKDPTRNGWFGLETYRLRSLLAFASQTQQDVMYTIHNHALNGGRDNLDNHISHWLTVRITDLEGAWVHKQSNGTSWVNGNKEAGIEILYWPVELWEPLTGYWATWVTKALDKEAVMIEEMADIPW